MKTALVTGSETFGKYLTHPSKWLALSVDGKVLDGHKIHSLVFPSVVLFAAGTEDPGEMIIRKAQEIAADVIVSFAMSSDVKGFRLERSGSNWISNEKYLSPHENNRPLDPSRPENEQLRAELSSWDLEKMIALFSEAQIPLESTVSDDAGRYSCNSWIYRTLLAMQRKQLTIPYLFVHTACTEEAIRLIPEFDRENKTLISNTDMLTALGILLRSYK